MDESDDFDSLLAATPQQKQVALTAALRGQQPPAELLFAMGQNPVAQPFGREALQAQQHAAVLQQQRELAAPRLALEQQQLGEAQRRAKQLADPNSQLTGFRRDLIKQFGGTIAPNASTQDISDQEFGLLERAQATKEMAAARRDAARMRVGTGGELPTLQDDALDIQVEQAVKTGTVPKFGAGPLGDRRRTAFWNRVAELYPKADLAGNAAGYHANVHSLEEAQKLADATDVNEGKALGDIQILEQRMKPLFDSGSPLLNAGARKLQENAGNPDVAAFLTARQAAVAQINKVLNAGTLTESARKEAEDLLKGDATLSQMRAVLQVLKQDMARSRAAMHQRISTTQARIGAKPGTVPTAEEPAAQDASGPVPTSTHYLVSPDGTQRIRAAVGPDGKPVLGPNGKPIPAPGATLEPNPKPPKVATNG